MFKLHTSDGRTVAVDMSDSEQAREWLPKLARDEAHLTGVTMMAEHGYQVNVVRPHGFDHDETRIEHVPSEGRNRGGERVIVFAGDVRLTVMSHAEHPAIRISLARIGKMRFNPNRR